MKRILGLDLGTTSIGWAIVDEAEKESEKSAIVKLGVRVVPLSTDEQSNYEKGKSITTNADRNLKHGMRLNLHRFKLRRRMLIECLKEHNIIDEDSILCETGNASTFTTYRKRAQAVTEEVTLVDFARILLQINKKRGYKSSRKSVSTDEGQIIDGMSVAKQLYEENLTPGQYVYNNLKAGKKYIPDFYRSDLVNELNVIWDTQRQFYPEILSDDFKTQIEGKTKTNVTKTFLGRYQIYTAENKGQDKRLQAYKWRSDAVKMQLSEGELAYVIADICGAIANSSGYLGSISDRSKELYFNNLTVGQYLMAELDANPNTSLKNQTFYRQDYFDEFERIWECQKQFHPQLTDELKREIRDIIIFFQRPLKSKKGMLDLCEFERKTIDVTIDGKTAKKQIGLKVCPKSSPLFQEFKIWQNLNNLRVTDNTICETRELELDEKQRLFEECNIHEKLSKTEALKCIFGKTKNLDLNFKEIDGNRTMAEFYKAALRVVAISGHDEYDLSKLTLKDIHNLIIPIFENLGINTDFLTFNPELESKAYYSQPAYKLWHLLYSYEGDNSKTGDESLVKKITELTGMNEEFAKTFANISFVDDYGNLSSKAMKKILPFMKAGNEYSLACEYAGYRHSKSSLTKKEIEAKELVDKLDLLPRNSLRNPVVEKILNQLINVVNQLVEVYGRPDEIRIELARELKKSAKEREELTRNINTAKNENDAYRAIISKEFGIEHVSKNDVLRYRLWMELKPNGFKTLYTNTYIPKEKVYSKDFDIEHIIPQARLFDDSFSNKTLESRDANIEKSNSTAYDYVAKKYHNDPMRGVDEYKKNIDSLYSQNAISKAKHDKLLMRDADIPEGFIERDLRNSQYIAKKAREILGQIVRVVVPTTGSITDRLREDWQLINVMQELNWDKYDKQGLTETYLDKDGNKIKKIKDWTKRNDHRHHAMDALTIAFTKQSFIQYLNNLNARVQKGVDEWIDLDMVEIADLSKEDKTRAVYTIEKKELHRDNHGKLRFNPPMPLDEFRESAKQHLKSVLVSIKAKNKVMTPNVNITKCNGGTNKKVQLTPRGALHNETIYGNTQRYATREIKVNASTTADLISLVCNKKFREALMTRIKEFNGDAKKAFTGKNALDKNPLYIDAQHTQQVPSKVKIVEKENLFPIRKAIDKDLKIDKVIDKGIQKILKARLDEYNGDAIKAFSNLDENPIWLNKEKGIQIKRVRITGITNAVALHDKKDHFGKSILDSNGKHQPVDYVNTGNNHHVAIFRDEKGELQEHIVSFMEATACATNSLPIVDKDYRKTDGWTFLFTMKQNEYFVFPNPETGFNPKEVDLLNPDNYDLISTNLFRVQKFTKGDYFFRHHLETILNDCKKLKGTTWKRIGIKDLANVIKVRIDHIGRIVAVGEY